MKLYDIILADPPWNHGSPGWFGGAKNHYPTMSLADICALPIPAADNCALFMWGCWSLMPEAFEVIKAWGFEYKTEAWVWVKLNSNSMGLFTGMGYYTRGNTEPCLLAIRGSMQPAVHDVPAGGGGAGGAGTSAVGGAAVAAGAINAASTYSSLGVYTSIAGQVGTQGG